MLLRGGEISSGIRLNGEKWGFSGGLGAVDGCKLLKGMKYPSFEKREEGPAGRGSQLLASERSLGGRKRERLGGAAEEAAEKA
jgi:hypothetical protein